MIGSRWVPGGVVKDWPKSRLLLSRGGNAYTRLALRMPVRDATGGYRAYRIEVLRALPLADVASAGYCFQVDLAWRAYRAGFRVTEVPITFVERAKGVSKMRQAIVTEALWRVTWWGATDLLSRGRRLAVGRLEHTGGQQRALPTTPSTPATGPAAIDSESRPDAATPQNRLAQGQLTPADAPLRPGSADRPG